MSAPDLHGSCFPQLPEGPCDGLPVGSHHARQLLVGVAGGYPTAAVACDNALVLAEAEYETRQPGRYLLADLIRESALAHGEPLAKQPDGLYPHLGVAEYKLLEVLPPKDERSRWLE